MADRPAGLRGEPDDRRPAEGIGPPVSRAAAGAQLSPLLAVQEAGDLPGDRAVVHRRGPRRPAGSDSQGDRRGPLAARVGPDADRGHGVAPAGLVHQPAAVLGRADPGSRAAPPAALSGSRPRRSATSATCSATEGADAWFTRPVEELLPPGAACPECGGTSFRKEGDILDVWFESGSSHRAVLSKRLRPELPGVHVPGRLGPAPRLVPVVDPDGRRDHRHRAVRDRADSRVRRRREGTEDLQVAGQLHPGRHR